MLAISMYRVHETAFLSVCERFMSVFAQKRSRNVQKKSETLDIRSVGRSEMVSNVGQSEPFILYIMNGMKRSRFKNERSTVLRFFLF